MFFVNGENCKLSIDERSFHRNYPDEIDDYDYFITDIQAESEFFNFLLKDVEIYIFHLNKLISDIQSLIKGDISEFEFSLYSDVMLLNFNRLSDGLSYCIYLTLKSPSDGGFILNGNINMTHDSIVEMFNDVKYFVSAYD